MIKAEYVHEALRKEGQYPLGLLENKQYAVLEEFFTQLWESRNDKNAFKWESDWFSYPYQMFADMFLNQGPQALENLQEWSDSYPDSFFPYVVRVRYWAFWASEYRGGTWANQVSEDMWDCAREAQKQIYVTAMQALVFAPNTWTVVIHLLNAAAKLEQPKWFDKWLFKQKRPQNLKHVIKPALQKIAGLSGLSNDLELCLPEQIPIMLAPYLDLQTELNLPQNEAAFWLKVFLDQSQYGLVAAIDYCWYLLPRWGYSYESIVEFVQSDWCDHFTEIEKNELNFVMWYDSIEDSYSEDQTGEIKKHIHIALDLLKRPLSEKNRAKIYLRLAYFYTLLNESDAQIVECYVHTIGHDVFDEYDLQRAINYWFKHARSSDFLGKIAISNRKTLASAAVLYGLLTQHGWSGIEKNPLVAQSWFEFAKHLEKPKPFPEGEYCCFYRVYKSFDELENYPYVIDMLHSASDLGYVNPSFTSGYIHSHEDSSLYDVDIAKKYSSKAAEQGHYIAMYNMGVNYLNRGIKETETNPFPLLKQSLDYFEQARIGLERSRKEGTYEYQELEDDIIDLYAGRLYHYSYYPELGDMIIPQLMTHGWNRHIKAMTALARLYADQANRPYYFDYTAAVKWCEAARLQDPEHADVLDAITVVETDSLKKILKYQFAVDKIPVEEMPGRQDVLF
jgi:hypothetical protein